MSAVQSCASTMCHIAYFVVALVSRFVSYRDASSLSQFSSNLVRGLHARARREKRGRASPVSRPRALAPSRPQVRAWSFACLARFARQTKEKETARSPHYQYIIRIAFAKSNLPRIPLQPQMLLFLNVVVSRQWIITVDNKTILLW